MEKLLFSLIVMVLGMLIVFVGLIILIGAIKLLSWVLGIKKPEPAKSAPAPESAPASVPAPAPESAPVPVVESGIDPRLVAVIMAAVVAQEGSNKALVVRSIRRAPSLWKNTARRESLNY